MVMTIPLRRQAHALAFLITIFSRPIIAQENSWQSVDARQLPDFLLFNDDFKPLRNEQMRGQWTLFFFGYMNCPDLCPTTLQSLATVLQRLRQQQADQLPQVIFVSIDPWRDTPNKLRTYVRYFDKSFVGASADEPQLNILTNFFKVIYYNNRSKSSPSEYEVAHSDSVMLINPEGEFVGYFKSPLNSDEITDKLAKLLPE